MIHLNGIFWKKYCKLAYSLIFAKIVGTLSQVQVVYQVPSQVLTAIIQGAEFMLTHLVTLRRCLISTFILPTLDSPIN